MLDSTDDRHGWPLLPWLLMTQDGATPLYIASQNGHHRTAELLLAKGADVNQASQVRGM